MPPVIGRITAGHTVVKGDKVYPVKDDHFTLTTLLQNDDTRVWQKHPLQEKLVKQGENLRAIPVRIAYNDVGLNLHNRYTAFDLKSGRTLCVGDGESARRITVEGVKELTCPGPEGCDFGAKQYCKSFTRAYFRIEGQEDELGVFILRSGSYNTLSCLSSRLSQLAGLTKGCIANMPLMLVLEAKTTTKSFRKPIYFADLVVRPGTKLKDAVLEARAYRDEMEALGLSIEGAEEALRTGLANSAFADEIEDVDEWVSDDDLLDAVNNQLGTVEGQGKGLAGMDSLSNMLGLKAAVSEGKAEQPQAPVDEQAAA
jgi:hypothetical protein